MNANLTVNQTAVLERQTWEFRGEDIVRVSHGSPQEILEAFAASLLESDPVDRFVLTAAVKYRDERGADCTVGLNVIVDGACQISSEHNVWTFAGFNTGNSGDRVELLINGNGPVLVTLVRIAEIWSSAHQQPKQLIKSELVCNQ